MTLNQLFQHVNPWSTGTDFPQDYNTPGTCAPPISTWPQQYDTNHYNYPEEYFLSDEARALKLRLASENLLIVELTKCLAEVENELARKSILDRIEAAEARKVAIQLSA